MHEYAFRFAYDSLRVSRILQSSPWSMFLGVRFLFHCLVLGCWLWIFRLPYRMSIL